MLKNLIDISYRQFSGKDLANPYELNVVNKSINNVKQYFFNYPFDESYTIENIADYLIVEKISAWDFRNLLSDEYKAIFDTIKQYFKEIKDKFNKKNIVVFLNCFDFVFSGEWAFDFKFALYNLLSRFNKSLTQETFLKAIKSNPLIVFDDFENYFNILKKYPDLFEELFNQNNLKKIAQTRLTELVDTGALLIKGNIINDIIKNRITNFFDGLGKEILANKDKKLALINQAKYKSILKFFEKISNAQYNFYYENQKAVDALADKWLDENGKGISLEMPLVKIKNIFDNPETPWYLKMLSLTHSKSKDKKELQHYCVLSMQLGRASLTELLCCSNVPTNKNFGAMTQQLLDMNHSLYGYALSYYVGDEKKWERYCENIQIFLQRIFSETNIAFDEVKRQLVSVKKKGKEYLFVKDGNDDEKEVRVTDFIDVNVKFIEKILRLIYEAEKRESKSFYLTNKLTLGVLLNYYDERNPLNKILTIELMQYFSFCLIKDKDENGVEVGVNLRNLIAHDAIDSDTINYSTGFLSLLILTGVINALFLYYNKKFLERIKKEKEEEIKIKQAEEEYIKKQSNIHQTSKKGMDLYDNFISICEKVLNRKDVNELFNIDMSISQIKGVITDFCNEFDKATNEYNELLNILDAMEKIEKELCSKIVDLYLFKDKTRKSLFSENYFNYIKKLGNDGLFLHLLMIPEIPENILVKDNSTELVCNLYALRLREIFRDELLKGSGLSNCIDDAIGYFEDNDYNKCVACLLQKIDTLVESLAANYSLYKSIKKESYGLEYYEYVVENILDFYRKIKTDPENWNGNSLNYFDFRKDTSIYKATDFDCIQMFTLINAIPELDLLFDSINYIIRK